MPNTSTPIRNGAISVLVALPKTAAYPSAPHNTDEIPNKFPRQKPSDAPIENRGVTSPPWNPIDNVITVKSSFIIQSKIKISPPVNVCDIRFVPSPQ